MFYIKYGKIISMTSDDDEAVFFLFCFFESMESSSRHWKYQVWFTGFNILTGSVSAMPQGCVAVQVSVFNIH